MQMNMKQDLHQSQEYRCRVERRPGEEYHNTNGAKYSVFEEGEWDHAWLAEFLLAMDPIEECSTKSSR